MQFKITHFSFLFGLLLAVCNNSILFIIVSSFLGIIVPYFRKSKIQSYFKRCGHFIYGFAFGGIIIYTVEIIVGLIVGYFVSEYLGTSKYKTFNKLLEKFSMKIDKELLIINQT